MPGGKRVFLPGSCCIIGVNTQRPRATRIDPRRATRVRGNRPDGAATGSPEDPPPPTRQLCAIMKLFCRCVVRDDQKLGIRFAVRRHTYVHTTYRPSQACRLDSMTWLALARTAKQRVLLLLLEPSPSRSCLWEDKLPSSDVRVLSLFDASASRDTSYTILPAPRGRA